MTATRFPVLDRDTMIQRLEPPRDKPVRLLIDTDAANEIDDQYALAWALLSPEQMTVEAMTAEPYSFAHHRVNLLAAERAILDGSEHNEPLVGGFQGWIHRLHAAGRKVDDLEFTTTDRGMELSYEEIITIYEKLSVPHAGKVFRGSDRYMTAADDPVSSEAADVIIDLAKSGGEPLYIAAMGCVTNVASALVKAPEIVENIVVIWTSSYPSTAVHSNRPSLNLVQDPHAARILFDSGVPHIYQPGYQVGAQLKISLPEMEAFVRGRGAIGDYLHHLYTNNPLHKMFALQDTARRTWVIWDIITIAWLINPDWVPTYLTTSPILDENLFWQKNDSRHLMAEAHDVQRDEIFRDFYDKLPAG